MTILTIKFLTVAKLLRISLIFIETLQGPNWKILSPVTDAKYKDHLVNKRKKDGPKIFIFLENETVDA